MEISVKEEIYKRVYEDISEHIDYTGVEIRMLQYLHIHTCKYEPGCRAWWKSILKCQGIKYKWWWNRKRLKKAGYEALYIYNCEGATTGRFKRGGDDNG